MTNTGPQSNGSGSKTLNTIIGLVVLVLIGAGAVAAIYFIYSAVADFLTSTSPQVGSAVIGTSGLVFVAVIANFGTKYLDRQQQIQQEQRAKKAEVYQEFMAFWFRALTSGEGDKEDHSAEFQEDVEKYVREFTHKLVAWGSKDFLTQYIAFKESIKSDYDAALLDFEKVLLEIRRDLGYKNKGLPRGILLKVFVAEPEIDAIIAAHNQPAGQSR